MTLNWFVGYDPRDDLAAKVAIRSMRANTNADVKVTLLKDHELRRAGFYWRSYDVRANGQMIDSVDGKPFSTAFSFSRFCAPELARAMDLHEPVLFTDADVLLRTDISKLFSQWDDRFSVMCVQHNHMPREDVKFDGLEQTKYFRKNWSSLMLMHPDKTRGLTPYAVNNWPGSQLHAMLWVERDGDIGPLGGQWNHLVGYDAHDPTASLVHFTLGTPDFPGRENDPFADEWRSYCTADELTALPETTGRRSTMLAGVGQRMGGV